MSDYVRDGQEIYRRSFATIRAEADLSRFPDDISRVVVRMIHACGMVDLADSIAYSPGVVKAARDALDGGAPILCDAQMVASGITRSRLPAANEVICTLSDPAVPGIAARLGNTRSAAAIDLWLDRLDGAVVAIGNAPTALFRLLDLIAEGAPRPAAISAFRSASSARPSRSRRWPSPISSTSSCTGGAAAARWRCRRGQRDRE